MAWTPAPGEVKTHVEFLKGYFSNKQPAESPLEVALNIILIAAGVRPCYLLQFKKIIVVLPGLQSYFDTQQLPVQIVIRPAGSTDSIGIVNTFICSPREIKLLQEEPLYLGFFLGYQCLEADYTNLRIRRIQRMVNVYQQGIKVGRLWGETCEPQHLAEASKTKVWEAIERAGNKLLRELGYFIKYDESEAFRISTRIYQTLLGPISLTEHYSKKYQKRVYIFGDQHHLLPRCQQGEIAISNFLHEIIKVNPDKIIDLFIELGMPDANGARRKLVSDNYLVPLHNFFAECLSKQKAGCAYPNLRAHYTDVRDLPLDDPYFRLAEVIRRIKKIYSQIIQGAFVSALSLEEPYKELETLLKNEFRKFKDFNSIAAYTRELFDKLKVTKQLANIKDPDVVANILTSFTECTQQNGVKSHDLTMKELLSSLSRVNKSLNKGKFKFAEPDGRLVEKFIQSTGPVGIGLCLMDVYLASRLFREFNLNRGRQSNHSATINHAIIYAGELHSKQYRQLLTRLGFELVAESQSPEQCLDISKFKQPFFW